MKRYIVINHRIETPEDLAKLELEIDTQAKRGFKVHTLNNYRTAGDCGRLYVFILMEKEL